MNEALKNELTKIYWNADKEESTEFKKCSDQFYEVFNWIRPVMVEGMQDKMEDNFIGAATQFGLDQFLWGYEYALTMMGRNYQEV